MLSTGCEDACYEHISLVKSGEHNQWIQLKRMLIEGSVPTPNTIVQHSFRIHFTSEEWSALHCFLCHALEMYSYSLSSYMITFALLLSYENPTNCNFYRILITEIHYLQWSSSPFLSWSIFFCLNSAKPLADIGLYTGSRGGVFS